MKIRSLVPCVIACVFWSVAIYADAISSVSPQSFYIGTAEEFVSINGSGLAGTDTAAATTVVFSGPAGTFTIEANTSVDTLLEVFVPTPVFSTAGTYAVTAFAHDLGGTSRQIGPGSLAILNRPVSTTTLLALPEVLIAEATSPSGAIVTFSAGATNPDGSTAAVSCDHASGSQFPLDTTVVQCTAGSAVGTFLVVVMDTLPPSLTIPGPITSANPIVTYSATSNDAIDGAVTPICVPASGSTFEFGTTTVLCTATDARANQTSGSFLVTVTCPITVTTLTLSERYISPNGDGQKDATAISLRIATGDIVWRANVKTSGGSVVRTWSGTGSCISLAWDGRDGNGAVVADGDYTVEVVNDGTGQQLGVAAVTVDAALPSVAISVPTNNQILSNVRSNGSRDVTVSFSITEGHLSTWTLVQTGNGQGTVTIASGSAAATSAIWHTDSLPNGAYTLTLTAIDLAGNSASTAVTVSLSEFSLTQNAVQIDRVAGETVAYTSSVPFTLTEAVTLKNASGAVVRTLWNGARAAGTYVDVWDGKNDQGVYLPDGPYSVTATATDGANSMTWDESGLFRPSLGFNGTYPKCRKDDGTLVSCDDSGITWDPFLNKPLHIVYCAAADGGSSTVQDAWTPGASGQFGCTGSVAALVQVKATSLAETPLTCAPASECIAQEYQAPGPHEVVWYGTSLTGADISHAPRLTAFRRGDIWPKNVVFAYGMAPRLSNLTITPILFNPGSAPLTLAGQELRLTVVTANASWNASLKAEFRNRSSGSVLRTITTASASAGSQAVVWDGRADNGAFVAPGIYDVTLTVTDAIGGTAVIKPVVIVRY
jgi:flagellar hook assembly protein FlgD